MRLPRNPIAPGVLALFLLGATASAQTHPFPGSVTEPLVICTGCKNFNSAGEPNDGKPTFPYDLPLAGHVGRYLSSELVHNVQHVGMRTIRADEELRVRGNRVYVDMGSTISVYPLDTFFTSRLREPMIPVTNLVTGYRYGQRSTFERLARPDAFIYPEAKTSGWGPLELFDSFERLIDFDTDDRGHVFYASNIWGWGIHLDDGRDDLKHLPFVARVPDSNWTDPLKYFFTMKVGQQYYAYVTSQSEARLYDITNAAHPSLQSRRSGLLRVHSGWAKHEAGERVAFVNSNFAVSVYSYSGLVADDAPLFTRNPASGRRFTDVAFDEHGNLWAVETPSSGSLFDTNLWKFTPSPGGGYEAAFWPVDTALFQGTLIDAGSGYVALGGKSQFGTGSRADARLLKVVDGIPQLLDTRDYFGNYYSSAPAGFADPAGYTSLPPHLFLTSHAGRTYLFYAAYGLGDVYELGAPVPPPPAPSGFTATGASATSVALRWDVVEGAAWYELFRRGAGGTFVSIGTTTASTFLDGGRTPDSAYAYLVRARDVRGTASPDSDIDVATTVVFTDPVIVPGMKIKAVHITDLRRAAAALGAAAGLAAPLLTDPELVPGTVIKSAHLTQLAAHVNAARQLLGAPSESLALSPIVRAADITDLMNQMK